LTGGCHLRFIAEVRVPIEIRGKVVGVIDILSGPPDFFTPLRAERIAAFAVQAAVAMENAQLFEQAQRLALGDSLTELHNMRYFNNFARLEFERLRHYKRPLSVAMADIGHFKQLNDTYGHKQGDLALHEIALRIKMRSARWTSWPATEEMNLLSRCPKPKSRRPIKLPNESDFQSQSVRSRMEKRLSR
jgi:PleD family two-component response regulator